jgi:hypothetical protein
VIGKIMKKMEKEKICILVVVNMKVNIRTMKDMDMEYMNGKDMNHFRPDGSIFCGIWKEGKQHGEGEYYNPKSKRRIKYVYKEGQIIERSNS